MCCKNFTSNATMLELFTSSMYNAQEEVQWRTKKSRTSLIKKFSQN
jgi:hypothetical protein